MTAIYYATPTGAVIYNGVTLNPTVSYTLSATTVMDDAARSYSHTEYTLQGKFVILGDVSASSYTSAKCSTRMQEIRDKLSQPGKTLELSSIGFGDLVVNAPAAGRTLATAAYADDVNWGPKPQVMDFAPFGGATAWEVIWTCRFSIIEPRVSNEHALLALNYKLDFQSDHRGLTTINIDGHYQIPLSIANYTVNPLESGIVKGPITADQFRDRILVTLPTDFRLKGIRTSFNEAKNRVDFSYQLQEAEGEAFPPGIVDADIDESWENEGPQNFSGWTGAISGWMEVAKGYPTTTAARQFLNIFTSRLNFIRSQALQMQNGGKSTPMVIPVRFSFGHKRFTRKYNFAAEYAVIGCLPDFLKSSGIWEPLGLTHENWVTSMKDVHNQRGVSKVKPGLDIVINTGNQARKSNVPINFTTTRPQDGSPVSTLTFDCSGITEENSYLAYENHVRVVKEASLEVHKYAQAPGTPTTGAAIAAALGFAAPSLGTTTSQNGAQLKEAAGSVFGALGGIGFSIDAVSVKPTSTTIASSATAANSPALAKADELEYTGTSTDYIVMHGRAMRIKFPPQAPKITEVAGQQAALKEEQVEAPQVIAMIGDCPVYVIRWAKVYYFAGGLPSTEVKPAKPAQWACLAPFG